ncbi:MAG: integrase domain-containing protein [Gammaproteobacteria bacterium]|nr:integrase domain-containing protein [Gammaproteobacteria bacterium]MDE0412527.1 integrase domain-containing protein [Gammaproteobacteria bacterium]
MRDLNYTLKQLCRHCREGSYATQRNRERILTLIANELHGMGYRHMRAESLKPKHTEALVKYWQQSNLSIGTIKNRMAAMRWWARKVNKQSVVARSNEHYGIPDRRFVTNENKARDLTQQQLDKVKDLHVRMSLELQRAFGLRREEAMKFVPSYADQGDHIQLKASWTKGGKPRTIPIRTEVQREVLNRARNLAGFSSLIPSHRSYVQQLRVYEGNTTRAGLSSMHGLRHAYAQERYEELTGWQCPTQGGPNHTTLSSDQKELDHQVRLTISRELGHEREQITAAYLGR